MKAEPVPCFAIKTAYWKADKPIKTLAEPLRKIAFRTIYDAGTQEGIWIFPMTLKSEVERILGVPIEIPGENIVVKKVFTEGDLREDGPFEIVGRTLDFDKDISPNQIDCFVVQHLKYGKDGRAKLEKFTVSFKRVDTVWDCIDESLEIGKSCESVVLHRKMCESLGIVRFNRGDNHEGSFDDDKFKGNAYTRNTFWRTLRLLDSLGQISYPRHKTRVTKLRDSFGFQKEFLPVVEAGAEED